MNFIMHYKDKSPEQTINKLTKILNDLGIKVEESWQEESSIGTYSLRVVFKGTEIGSNGKGVTRDFAKASAYAEFFERYQNGLLIPNHLSKPNYGFIYYYDEKWMGLEELVNQESAFLDFYFKVTIGSNKNITDKINMFSGSQNIDKIMFNKKDYYLCFPFYNVNRNKIEYLPKNTYFPFYGSNGMCAGNTAEEALVQGYSEIIERVVQKKLFLEKPNLPDIPEEYIQNYSHVYEMYKKLKGNDKFVFLMKDCSFGGKYPVAGLIIIEKNTGKYGVKLGCHPNYGIAMERAFTEAAQGQDIYEYVNRSKFDFENQGVEEAKNIYNSYKVGQAQYPYQIFSNDDVKFTPVKEVSGMSNADILNQWTQEIIDDGYEILIRDVSYFGFPSYHVIIPGLSEMLVPSEQDMRANNTRCYVSKLLETDLSSIGKEECKYIVATMNYYMGNIFEDTLSKYYSIVNPSDLPCEIIGGGCSYLASMCYAMQGKFKLAKNRMHLILKNIKKLNKSISDCEINLYNAIYMYYIMLYICILQLCMNLIIIQKL